MAGVPVAIGATYATFVEDFESALRSLFADYALLEAQGRERLGSTSKPLVARYVCERLDDGAGGWEVIARLADAIRDLPGTN